MDFLPKSVFEAVKQTTFDPMKDIKIKGIDLVNLVGLACIGHTHTASSHGLEPDDSAVRSNTVQAIVTSYCKDMGIDQTEALASLLADLRHFCDAHQLQFKDIDRNGHLQYTAERYFDWRSL